MAEQNKTMENEITGSPSVKNLIDYFGTLSIRNRLPHGTQNTLPYCLFPQVKVHVKNFNKMAKKLENNSIEIPFLSRTISSWTVDTEMDLVSDSEVFNASEVNSSDESTDTVEMSEFLILQYTRFLGDKGWKEFHKSSQEERRDEEFYINNLEGEDLVDAGDDYAPSARTNYKMRHGEFHLNKQYLKEEEKVEEEKEKQKGSDEVLYSNNFEKMNLVDAGGCVLSARSNYTLINGELYVKNQTLNEEEEEEEEDEEENRYLFYNNNFEKRYLVDAIDCPPSTPTTSEMSHRYFYLNDQYLKEEEGDKKIYINNYEKKNLIDAGDCIPSTSTNSEMIQRDFFLNDQSSKEEEEKWEVGEDKAYFKNKYEEKVFKEEEEEEEESDEEEEEEGDDDVFYTNSYEEKHFIDTGDCIPSTPTNSEKSRGCFFLNDQFLKEELEEEDEEEEEGDDEVYYSCDYEESDADDGGDCIPSTPTNSEKSRSYFFLNDWDGTPESAIEIFNKI